MLGTMFHFSPERMAIIDHSISPADFEYIRSCVVCNRAKLHKRPFLSKPDSVKATTAGEVVSLDLLTMTKKTWDNKGYMLVLVDQYTKFIAIFAYEDKKSAMRFVQTFVALCANVFDVRVKCLH